MATRATEDARELARGHVAEAKRELAAAGLEPERRRLLDLVADGVVERYA